MAHDPMSHLDHALHAIHSAGLAKPLAGEVQTPAGAFNASMAQMYSHQYPDGTIRVWVVDPLRQLANRISSDPAWLAYPDRSTLIDTAGFYTTQVLTGLRAVDPQYVRGIDLSCSKPPIVIGTRLEGVLVDGGHRVVRAFQLGIKKLPAVVLSMEEARPYELPFELAARSCFPSGAGPMGPIKPAPGAPTEPPEFLRGMVPHGRL